LNQIKYLTHSALLHEAFLDPLLLNHSTILVSNECAPTLEEDFLLGQLKKVLRRRTDFRLIFSTFIKELEGFAIFLDNSSTSTIGKCKNIILPTNLCISLRPTVLSIRGSKYPIEIHNLLRPCRSYLQHAICTIFSIHRQKSPNPGDILVFLPKQEDCEIAADCIKACMSLRYNLIPFKINSNTSKKYMNKINKGETSSRKVIFVHSMMDNSINLEEITYIIDSCLMTQYLYNSINGSVSSFVCAISKQTTELRKKSLGKKRPGQYFRLCTKKDYKLICPELPMPAVQRADITEFVLKLLSVCNLYDFDYISPPPIKSIRISLKKLYKLGAIDSKSNITPEIGKIMCEIPLSPHLSKCLLASCALGCFNNMLIICSILSFQNHWNVISDSIFIQSSQKKIQSVKNRFSVINGDLITLLNIWTGWKKHFSGSKWAYNNLLKIKSLIRIDRFRSSLMRQLINMKFPVNNSQTNPEAVQKALICGFFTNIAFLSPHYSSNSDSPVKSTSNNLYQMLEEDDILSVQSCTQYQLKLHYSSVLIRYRLPWLLFYKLHSDDAKAYEMFDLTKIEPHWLISLVPHYFSSKEFS
jgi:HrpA-like RNA helicase